MYGYFFSGRVAMFCKLKTLALAALSFLFLFFGTESFAGCGRLCSIYFWQQADINQVKLEIARGGKINAYNSKKISPLHRAVQYSSEEVVELLLQKGAHVNAQDDKGMTPLHYAAGWAEDAQLVSLLVGYGAVVGSRSHRRLTPLHIAAAHNQNAYIVENLLKHGADPEVEDRNGYRPAHYAAGNKALRKSPIYRHLLGMN